MKFVLKKPVSKEHAKLRRIASKLKAISVTDPDFDWLSRALDQIGNGDDANIVLGVKRTKGHDRAKLNNHYVNEMVIRWIAGRLYPIENEPAPKRIEAIREAATLFGLDEENLARVCPSKKALEKLAVFDWDTQRPTLKKPRD